jgi:phosphatidylglycerophosphatase A
MQKKWGILRDPRGWIASGLGSGLAPFAPGTFGSLAALPFCYLLGAYTAWPIFLLCVLLCFGIGCWAAGWVIRVTAAEDPGLVVIDEWVGMALTWFPVAYFEQFFGHLKHPTWMFLGPAFLAFRLADIAKPWPASWADKQLHGGFGTMLDDALAAIWSAALIVLLIKFCRFG